MHTATDLTPRARRWLTAACLVGAFLGSMEVMVVSPVMPSITEELGQAGLTPWVVTTFMLAQVVAMPLFGRLADTWGRRDAWLLGVGLFALGNLVASLAPGMGALLVGRFLQGLGGGALIPIALILFGDLYEPIERTRLQALFSVVWGVSSLIGPGLGGGLTEAFGWRSIFWTPLPVAVGLVGLILALLPRRLGQRPPSANPGGPRQALREVATIYEHPIQRLIAGAGFLMGAGLLSTCRSGSPWWRAAIWSTPASPWCPSRWPGPAGACCRAACCAGWGCCACSSLARPWPCSALCRWFPPRAPCCRCSSWALASA